MYEIFKMTTKSDSQFPFLSNAIFSKSVSYLKNFVFMPKIFYQMYYFCKEKMVFLDSVPYEMGMINDEYLVRNFDHLQRAL